jgi:hypothetical protein
MMATERRLVVDVMDFRFYWGDRGIFDTNTRNPIADDGRAEDRPNSYQ